jgi:hypothetical protein
VAIRRKLQKISEVYKPLGKGDVPDVRYRHPRYQLALEFLRPADHDTHRRNSGSTNIFSKNTPEPA